jgi:hypothetical protein
VQHRIEFARETLRGNQQLIQLLDQKSYWVLVIIGVTSAAFFVMPACARRNPPVLPLATAG